MILGSHGAEQRYCYIARKTDEPYAKSYKPLLCPENRNSPGATVLARRIFSATVRERVYAGEPALLLLASGSAQAALIDQGQTTLDSTTGYQWLDVSLTTDCSCNLIAAGGICNGIDTSQWTFATELDVKRLWEHGGFDLAYLGDTTNESNYAAVLSMIDMFGCTFFCGGMPSDPYYSPTLNGLIVGDSPVHIVQLGIYPYQDQIFGIGRIIDSPKIPGSSQPASGAWLYQVTAVPVPAAVWLFGSALAGLGWFRHRTA